MMAWRSGSLFPESPMGIFISTVRGDNDNRGCDARQASASHHLHGWRGMSCPRNLSKSCGAMVKGDNDRCGSTALGEQMTIGELLRNASHHLHGCSLVVLSWRLGLITAKGDNDHLGRSVCGDFHLRWVSKK